MTNLLTPKMIYGTAWKKTQTHALTTLALKQGFLAIDTANQLKHYDEAQVGKAVQDFLAASGRKRSELFLQTKFTSLGGQDHRLPYERNASLSTQVEQSFQSSLEHFGTDYLDSYLLHGPTFQEGLTDEDWEIWRAIEIIYKSQKSKAIGVSNVGPDQLQNFLEHAEVKPMFVQNRCYAVSGWDQIVRTICKNNKIHYEGFSLLTANPFVLTSKFVEKLSGKYHVTSAQIVFRFCQMIGMIPLTGTTDPTHMTEDLMCNQFSLEPSEIEAIESIAL